MAHMARNLHFKAFDEIAFNGLSGFLFNIQIGKIYSIITG